MEKHLIQKYKDYQAADLALDLRFQWWVHGNPDPFWEELVEKFPNKQEEVSEAKTIVENLKFNQSPLNDKEKEGQLEGIYREIERREKSKVPGAYRFNYFKYAAAAILLIILFSGLMLWLLNNDYEQYQTGYKETTSFKLMDGTEVMLNANSSLKSFSSIQEDVPREVWLQGEAYFNVQSLSSQGASQQFIVHTNNLDIEVVGTKFNVKNRARNTSVFLEEGTVKVGLKTAGEKIFMESGELIELIDGEEQLQQKKEVGENHLAWKNNQFVFENTTLEKVAKEMEYYFGKAVVFRNEALKDKIFTARVERDNQDLLLRLIRESFNLEVEETEEAIILKE